MVSRSNLETTNAEIKAITPKRNKTNSSAPARTAFTANNGTIIPAILENVFAMPTPVPRIWVGYTSEEYAKRTVNEAIDDERAIAKNAVITERFEDCMTGRKHIAATMKPSIVDFLRPNVSMHTIAAIIPGSSENADNVMSR